MSVEPIDAEIYAELVRRHSRQVVGLCWAMLKDGHAAEEVAQEALFKGFLCRQTLRDPGAFFPWIRQIAVRLCVDVLRRRKLENRALTTLASVDQTRGDCAGDEAEGQRLGDALGILPASLRL